MKNIIDHIPKQKQKAIKEAWMDEDGYWIKIKEGWHIENYYAEHTIHEDTLTKIKEVSRQIRKDPARPGTVATMRIKHTSTEFFGLYNYLPSKDGIKRWWPYKNYRTKQSALNALKRIKEKYTEEIEKKLIWKIEWSPYPFAKEEDRKTVYTEETEWRD